MCLFVAFNTGRAGSGPFLPRLNSYFRSTNDTESISSIDSVPLVLPHCLKKITRHIIPQKKRKRPLLPCTVARQERTVEAPFSVNGGFTLPRYGGYGRPSISSPLRSGFLVGLSEGVHVCFRLQRHNLRKDSRSIPGLDRCRVASLEDSVSFLVNSSAQDQIT